MFQFTIRQMTIVTAIVAFVLALTEAVLRDDPLASIVAASSGSVHRYWDQSVSGCSHRG